MKELTSVTQAGRLLGIQWLHRFRTGSMTMGGSGVKGVGSKWDAGFPFDLPNVPLAQHSGVGQFGVCSGKVPHQ